MYINHDPVMTLTQFMARSTRVAYAVELGKPLKCHLKGKASRILANGVKYHNIQHVYWYMQQISGERLQDHWSSGLHFVRVKFIF